MDHIRALAQETDKILRTPYDASLKPLLHVLEFVSPNDLFIWSCVKACQIQPLVAKLASRVSTDHCACLALSYLIRAGNIRDEVFLQSPILFYQTCFQRQLISSKPDENSHQSCMNSCNSWQDSLGVLDSPMPKDVPVPQDYVLFFEDILSNAADLSPQQWARQVNRLLNAFDVKILDFIDDSVVEAASRLWNGVLKSNDNYEFLCCLDIAYAMNGPFNDVISTPSSNTTISSRTECKPRPALEWRAKCKTLLNEKASRLMRPIVLRALYVLSDKPDVTLEMAMDAMRMIGNVFESVDPTVVSLAMKNKENVEALLKLISKTVNTNLPAMLRLMVCRIIIHLDPEARYWRSSTRKVLELVLTLPNIADLALASRYLRGSVPGVLMGIACIDDAVNTDGSVQQIPTNTIRSILQFVINNCAPSVAPSVEDFLRIEYSAILVEAFRTISDDLTVSLIVGKCVKQLEYPEYWQVPYVCPNCPLSCAELDVCQHQFDSKRQDTMSCITDLSMKAICVSSLGLDPVRYQLLKQQMGNQPGFPHASTCEYTKMRKHELCSSGVDATSTIMFNLEDDLEGQLTNITDQTCRVVRQYINRVCHELEARCENVEAPLRAERERRGQLEQDLTAVKLRLDEAVIEHKLDKENLQQHIQQLQDNTTNAQSALEQVTADYERDSKMWRNGKQRLEDALQTACTEREDLLVQKQSDNTQWRSRYEDLDKQLRQVVHARDKSASEVETLQSLLQQNKQENARLLEEQTVHNEHIRSLIEELGEAKTKEGKLRAVLCDGGDVSQTV